MNRHSNTYDTERDIENTDSYEYQQALYENALYGECFICRDKLNGCQRLRSERDNSDEDNE